jgi:hypothetical protein
LPAKSYSGSPQNYERRGDHLDRRTYCWWPGAPAQRFRHMAAKPVYRHARPTSAILSRTSP